MFSAHAAAAAAAGGCARVRAAAGGRTGRRTGGRRETGRDRCARPPRAAAEAGTCHILSLARSTNPLRQPAPGRPGCRAPGAAGGGGAPGAAASRLTPAGPPGRPRRPGLCARPHQPPGRPPIGAALPRTGRPVPTAARSAKRRDTVPASDLRAPRGEAGQPPLGRSEVTRRGGPSDI